MRAGRGGRSTFFDVEGPELGWTAQGWRRRATMLSVPSGPGFSQTTLRPWLSPLEAFVRVAYLDLPGAPLGQIGDDPDFGLDSYVLDLEQVGQSLGGGPFVLLGHGWGACPAVEFARAHPSAVAALVLVCPITRFTSDGQDAEARLRMAKRVDVSLMSRFVVEVAPSLQAAMAGAADWESVERLSWWPSWLFSPLASLCLSL